VLEQRGKDERASQGGWGSDFWPGGRQLLEGAAFRAGLMRWGAAGSEIGVGGRRPGARGLEWRLERRGGVRDRESRGDDDPTAQPLSKPKKYQSQLYFPYLDCCFLRNRTRAYFRRLKKSQNFEESRRILLVFTWSVLLLAM